MSARRRTPPDSQLVVPDVSAAHQELQIWPRSPNVFILMKLKDSISPLLGVA
ncbi:MAG: hypothetical protein K9G49_01705 [Taibaiella sp.]|nr:hypothetical protein [Taibaiella sp.]